MNQSRCRQLFYGIVSIKVKIVLDMKHMYGLSESVINENVQGFRTDLPFVKYSIQARGADSSILSVNLKKINMVIESYRYLLV